MIAKLVAELSMILSLGSDCSREECRSPHRVPRAAACQVRDAFMVFGNARAHYKAYIAVACLILLVGSLKLKYLESFMFNNDNFATLSTFFHSSGDPVYQRAARLLYAEDVQ